MPSSNDDSGKFEDSLSNVVDIRDRLPAAFTGIKTPSTQLAAKILRVLSEDKEGKVYDHLAALIMTSHIIQKMLKESCGFTEDEMQYMRAKALDITESITVNLSFKKKDEDKG